MWKCVIFLLFTLSLAERLEDPGNNDVGKATGTLSNRLLDRVLGDLKNSRVLDRVDLPNVTLDFDVLWALRGKAILSRGILTGLSTINRTGDAIFLVSDTQGIDVRADMGVGPLNVTYVGIVRVAGIGQAVVIDAGVSKLQLLFRAKQVPDGKPELVDFQVKELKGLTVSVRGLGYLSWMLNWILKKLTTHFDKQIRSIVESKVRVALAEKLKEIKFEI